jgi:hypothetical protein
VGGVGVLERLRLGEMGRGDVGGGGGEGRGILLLAVFLDRWGGFAVLVGWMAEVRGGGRLWGGLGSHGGRGWKVLDRGRMGAVTEGVIVEWKGRWEDVGVIQVVVWYMWCGSGRCVHAGSSACGGRISRWLGDLKSYIILWGK